MFWIVGGQVHNFEIGEAMIAEENLDDKLYIHPTVEEGLTFWWIVPGDGSRALNMGEIGEVGQLWQALGRLLAAGEHDGEISSDHWQIAHQMTTGDAAELYDIPQRTLRSACATGLITAQKVGKTWVMSASSFHTWRLKWPRTRTIYRCESCGKALPRSQSPYDQGENPPVLLCEECADQPTIISHVNKESNSG